MISATLKTLSVEALVEQFRCMAVAQDEALLDDEHTRRWLRKEIRPGLIGHQ